MLPARYVTGIANAYLALLDIMSVWSLEAQHDPGEGKGFWPDAHDRMHSQHHTTPHHSRQQTVDYAMAEHRATQGVQ